MDTLRIRFGYQAAIFTAHLWHPLIKLRNRLPDEVTYTFPSHRWAVTELLMFKSFGIYQGGRDENAI